MKATLFTRWRSFARISVAAAVFTAVFATQPALVQAADYPHSTKGWLQACQKVGKKLTKHSFTYGIRSRDTLKEGIEHGRKANCAAYVSWCLQEFGVVGEGDTLYTKGGKLVTRFDTWQRRVKIIKVKKKAGKVTNLKPGDIVGWKDIVHMNIYAGENSYGEKLWLDGGSAATAPGRPRRYYRANQILPYNYLDNHKISFIIRIKGL